MTARVTTKIENKLAFVTLTRADKHNAIDMAMFKEINNATKALKKNKDIRAVIIQGEGDNFCTGLDVKSMFNSPTNALKLLFKWLPWMSNDAQRVSTAWRKLPVPVIAVLHGKCWGGGMQLALGADFRIAHTDTSLSIMESRWGLIPDMGGTLALRENISIDQAKKLAMTAEEISASHALSIGLITDVSNEPLTQALALADIISKQSPDSVAAVKKLYNKSWLKSDGYTLALETCYQIKVAISKNRAIKSYNQTHDESEAKPFNKHSW